VIRYAILCTYPSGGQRLVSTYLEEQAENIPEEFLECLQGCNPNNYYEIVSVEILHPRVTNAQQLPLQQRVSAGIPECPVE